MGNARTSSIFLESPEKPGKFDRIAENEREQFYSSKNEISARINVIRPYTNARNGERYLYLLRSCVSVYNIVPDNALVPANRWKGPNFFPVKLILQYTIRKRNGGLTKSAILRFRGVIVFVN